MEKALYDTLDLKTWRARFGGSLLRNACFGDLAEARVSHESVLQECPAKVSPTSVLQKCSKVFGKSVPVPQESQECRHKSVPQECPARGYSTHCWAR